MMTSNFAAWLTHPKSEQLEVGPAPLWTPGENEILLKNHALAVNPIDSSIQMFAYVPLDYPTILGHDVAGEVTAVGPNVSRFKEGDRVIGSTAGLATKRHGDNGFQAFSILKTNMCSKIPDDLSYANGVVIPLGLSTAAAGLFQDNFLHLNLPSEPRQKPTNKTLLIWGGSSSIGCNAIQLAVAAGYNVIVTASPRNFEYVRKLGATEAFDYNAPSIVDEIVKVLVDKDFVGIMDCIGPPAWEKCISTVDKSKGIKFIATTRPGFPKPPQDVTMQSVFATNIMNNEVGKAVWENYLPNALKTGAFVPAPEPLIAGKGLNSVQEALRLHRKGVSAKKVVVLL